MASKNNNNNLYERLAILVLIGHSCFLSSQLRSLKQETTFLYQWNIVKKIRIDILECKLLNKGCKPWMKD